MHRTQERPTLQGTLLVAVPPSWYAPGMTEKHPKRRRWFQFRLRTLLIAIVVLSLPLSWFAMRMKRVRRQRQAVATIERLGGYVQYEEGQVATPATAGGVSQACWSWLRSMLGDDFLFDVVEVAYLPPEFGDKDVACLKGLVNLGRLALIGTGISDAGLEHLQGMTSLEALLLDGTAITDAGLKYLEGLTNLEALALSNAEITDVGLERLQEMSRLRLLYLDNTGITDAGLTSGRAD